MDDLTPAKTGPELVTPPHGRGKLLTQGAPGNKGGGRYPRDIRLDFRKGMTKARIKKIQDIADGKPAKKLVIIGGKSTEVLVSPTFNEQTRAAEFMARVGLSTEYQIGVQDKELAIQVMRVAFDFIAPEKHEEFKKRLKEAAGHLVDG